MTIRLRHARKSDCELLFDWVNDPSVRRSAFNQETIDYSQHQAWFNSKLLNDCTEIFIAEQHGSALGQVRFEIDGTAAEIDVSIASTHRGRNLAWELIKTACSEIFQLRPPVEKIVAHIKTDNHASTRSFAKAGFSSPVSATHNGFRCLEMELKRGTITI